MDTSSTHLAKHRTPRSVFLHTGWRTAGTWVWSRFRALPEVRGYYEPFHEALAASGEQLATMRADAWESGHPHLDKPYFDEYLRLMSARSVGAPHYEQAFDLDRFSPLDAGMQLKLKRYLDGLLQAAQQDDQVAVLKFCRSMGRLPWITQTYPDALHVAVLRNPAAQWASAWQQLKKSGNSWFIYAPYRVLAGNLDSNRVVRLLNALGCDVSSNWATLSHAHGDAYMRAARPEAHYRVFLALWTLNTMMLSEQIDAIVDSDLLSLSPLYGQRCAALLREQCGLPIDFRNAHPASVSVDPRDAADWLGFSASEAFHCHALVDQFLRDESSEPDMQASASLACTTIRAKLALANRQALFGGAMGQSLPPQLHDPMRYCTDILAFETLASNSGPSPAPRAISAGAASSFHASRSIAGTLRDWAAGLGIKSPHA